MRVTGDRLITEFGQTPFDQIIMRLMDEVFTIGAQDIDELLMIPRTNGMVYGTHYVAHFQESFAGLVVQQMNIHTGLRQ